MALDQIVLEEINKTLYYARTKTKEFAEHTVRPDPEYRFTLNYHYEKQRDGSGFFNRFDR